MKRPQARPTASKSKLVVILFLGAFVSACGLVHFANTEIETHAHSNSKMPVPRKAGILSQVTGPVDPEPPKPLDPDTTLVVPPPPPPPPPPVVAGRPAMPIPTTPAPLSPDLTAVSSFDRADAVRAMMGHAWRGYSQRAWGSDEVRPVSGAAFDWLGQGATIVDSLDTLWLMGMKEEFKKARDWVAENLHFNQHKDVSVFETVIRVVGGLLSAYDLSGDELFLKKARECADALLPAYRTPSGIPYTTINFGNGGVHNPSWNGGSAVLAEAGTIQMEFYYLSNKTGDPRYYDIAKKIIDVLDKQTKPHPGLYPIYLGVDDGRFRSGTITLGAMGDSFYEYLVKVWALYGGRKNNAQSAFYRRMYEECADGIVKQLVKKSSPTGLIYLAELDHGSVNNKMDHLACFATGMFALGAKLHNDSIPGGNPHSGEHMAVAAGIARTCHEMYARHATGIAPELVHFHDGGDFKSGAHHYLLRPETVEAFFYMWRYTHDEMYRTWGWEVFKSLERWCRSEYGYSGLNDVRSTSPGKDNAMPSYFLAETIKYLYLLFSPDELVPLDRYVFNTEAHPLSMFVY